MQLKLMFNRSRILGRDIIHMQLFESIQVLKNKKYTLSDYELVCSSEKPKTIKNRKLIEHWFSRFPKHGLSEFLGRFKSKKDDHHIGALFELFTYNLLLGLGLDPVKNSGKNPDFKIMRPNNRLIYIECRISGDSISQDPAHKYSDRLYEKLNEESFDYWINIGIEKIGLSPIPEGKFSRLVKKMIDTLDYEEQLLKAKEHNFSNSRIIVLNDWEIEVSFRAKPKEIIDTSTDNIGGYNGGLLSIESPKYILNALNDKRSRDYDLNGAPYIIALNSLEIGLTEYELLIALIGSESKQGFFNKNKNTSISAILLTNRMNAWNVNEPNLTIYHNPWALRPINKSDFNLNQIRIEVENGAYKLLKTKGLNGQELAKVMSE